MARTDQDNSENAAAAKAAADSLLPDEAPARPVSAALPVDASASSASSAPVPKPRSRSKKSKPPSEDGADVAPECKPILTSVPPPDLPAGVQDIAQEDKPPSSNAEKGRRPDRKHDEMMQEKLTDEEVKDKEANRQLRDKYAARAYELACGCIGFWVILIGADATLAAALGRHVVSDNVLIAVTTGVTVNVLAAFLGVIRGLFPASSSSRTPNDTKPR